MFRDERQQRIAELITARGRVRTSELVELFGVTEATIRKDLSDLEVERVLKRTHGGAIARRHARERALDERATLNIEAKDAIAKLALDFIEDGDAVFLDSGSTVQRIAEQLRGRHLTVLTTAIGVALAVAELPGIEHVLLGGRVRLVGRSLVGSLVLENLERFTVNKAFLGVSGISEAGVTVTDLEEARVKATVIERARQVVVPADHSKRGATDFAHVCSLDDVDVLLCDRRDAYLAELCAEHQVQLVTPGDHVAG